LGGAAAGLMAVVAACGEGTQLPDPTTENAIDTVTIYALNGTAIGTESAFDIVVGLARRPELHQEYDFAFDIDSANRAILLPGNLSGLPSSAGLQVSSTSFDEIVRAPLDEYVSDTALVVQMGMVFLGRSRSSTTFCSAYVGSIPRYAKFEVIELDLAARTVTLEFLANLNCGYRDLLPGLPEN
jgi:hypothetical protein